MTSVNFHTVSFIMLMQVLPLLVATSGCSNFENTSQNQNANIHGVYRDNAKLSSRSPSACWINPKEDIALVSGITGIQAVEDIVTKEYKRAGISVKFIGKCPKRSLGKILSRKKPEDNLIKILIEDNQNWGMFGCKYDKWCVRLNFTYKKWPHDCKNQDWNNAFACHCALDTYKQGCLENNGLHEFGHALGLQHETNHQTYIEDPKCFARTNRDSRDRDFGSYDPDSIMNYCHNKKQMLGQIPSYLSIGDINTLKFLYTNKSRK